MLAAPLLIQTKMNSFTKGELIRYTGGKKQHLSGIKRKKWVIGNYYVVMETPTTRIDRCYVLQDADSNKSRVNMAYMEEFELTMPPDKKTVELAPVKEEPPECTCPSFDLIWGHRAGCPYDR